MKKTLIILVVVIGTFSVFFFGARTDDIISDQIIFTQIPIQTFKAGTIFPEKARIVSIRSGNPESTFELLSKDFSSARSPYPSFDGTKVLISGRLEEKSIWQIYEIDLNNHEIAQITNQASNCTDPVYLADGEILFSQEIEDSLTGKSFALFKTSKENSVEQLTFHPHMDLLSTISMDGRVVTNSRQIFPVLQKSKFLAMRPDGTKASLYYQGLKGSHPVSRGYEVQGSQFVFIEEVAGKRNRELVGISLNRPLNSRETLATGGFYSVYPANNDNLLVSFQEKPDQPIGLYYFNLVNNQIGPKVLLDQDYHSLEVVNSSKKRTPRKLPSRVDPSKETGKMLCMNTNITDLDPENEYTISAVKILTTHEVLKEVQVEKDGSFYIELRADTPIRYQALDADGNEILDPSSWLWVRPNESQGCVGCHADRELTPNNQVPEAINKQPIPIFHNNSESE